MNDKDQVYQVSETEMHTLKRFVFWSVAGTIALAFLAVVFIFTADTWMRHVSFAAEKRFIKPHLDFALEHGFSPADPEVEKYLNQLAFELAERQGLPEEAVLEVHFIKGDMANAFATLGSHILVFEGLLKEMPDENTLAMVLAHEIAHIKHRDPIVSVGRGIALQVLLSGGSNTGGIESEATNFSEQVAGNIYSRDQERAADEAALETLYKYYGHVWGAEQLFFFLAQASDEEFQKSPGEVTRIDEWFSTHPTLYSRMERMRDLAKEKGWTQSEPSPFPEVVLNYLNNKP